MAKKKVFTKINQLRILVTKERRIKMMKKKEKRRLRK